jgi:S-methylmethionine-dependent homocysteine/selenocysteine methylase
LQYCLVAGLSENLARKAPVLDAQGNEIPVTAKTKVVYESQVSKDKLSLHKLSALFKNHADLCVFTDMYSLDEGKQIMKNVTKVESTVWIQQLCSPILLQYSKPLVESKLPSPELRLAKLMAKTQKTSLVTYADG